MRVLLLTSAAMFAFAANSLLTRGALGASTIDAASFTLIRLVTGALTLAVLIHLRGAPRSDRGRWVSAAMLAGYAVTFTFAYADIDASTGALLLFGAVQVTMIGAGIARGERPRILDWLGVVLAAAGLLVLTMPGVTAPNVTGAGLMIAGGICWGMYSLAGRDSRDPLASTGENFSRATALAVVPLAWLMLHSHITVTGALMAAASGSLASGVGYTVWYAALPSLPAWRAALVQLVVPILTAFGAVVLLGEAVGPRLAAATALIAAGVWLTTWPARPR